MIENYKYDGNTILVQLFIGKLLHQLIGSLSHYLQGFLHARWCRISAINNSRSGNSRSSSSSNSSMVWIPEIPLWKELLLKLYPDSNPRPPFISAWRTEYK